jgi:hypothetical protein
LPETAKQLYERAKDALRMPPLEEWDSFPFDGQLAPKALEPPIGTAKRAPAALRQLRGDLGRRAAALPDDVWRENVKTFRAAFG